MPVFDKQAGKEEELLKRLPDAKLSGEEPEEAHRLSASFFRCQRTFLIAAYTPYPAHTLFFVKGIQPFCFLCIFARYY